MKKFVFSIVGLVFLFVGCNPEGNKENPEEVKVPEDISLNEEVFEIPQAGGKFTLTATAPKRPSLSGVPSWASIPDGTYNPETYTISYYATVQENATYSDRNATITVKSGTLSKTFTVSQPGRISGDDAPKEMTLDKHNLNIARIGGSATVIVSSPVEASVGALPSWLSVNASTFKDYKIKFIFTAAAANDSYEELTAEVEITAGDFKDKVTIVQAAKEKEPEPSDNPAWQMAEKLALGWNIGNQLDAFHNWAGSDLWPNETCWGNEEASLQTFTKAKAAGFASVRIPVTWLSAIGAAPDYKIDETWMSRVETVVGYAHSAGLNVIINMHHDENHHSITDSNGKDVDNRWQDIKAAAASSAVNTQIKQEITATWTQIANRFKNCGDWLIFESFNEINDGGWGWSDDFRANPTKQCNILNEWNQTFVDAVRATGGNNATRWLGVPTYAANPEFAKYFTMPDDPANHMMLAVHFYDPSDYTIGKAQYSDWGHTGNGALKANWGDEEHVRDVFRQLYNNYVAKGTPVYLGEFGCSMRDKAKTRAWAFYLYYMEYVVKAAKTYGLPAFLWDNGTKETGQEQHGYIDHGTGDYIGNSKEVVDIIVNAMNNNSESYTLESVYNNAPTF